MSLITKDNKLLTVGDKAVKIKSELKAMDLIDYCNKQNLDTSFLFNNSGQILKQLENVSQITLPKTGQSVFSNNSNIKKIPKITFKSVGTIYTSGSNRGLFNNMFSGLPNLESVEITIENDSTGNSQQCYEMFYGNTSLKKVVINHSRDVFMIHRPNYMFGDCSSLEVIEGTPFGYYKSTYDSFVGCKSLKEVRFARIDSDIRIASGTSYGHLLSIESLLSAVQACRAYESSSYTLTVGSENIAKLKDVYVKIVDETDTTYYPIEQCEASDEGALTIQDYLALKNWKLA